MRLIELVVFPLLAVLASPSLGNRTPADRLLFQSGIVSEHRGDLAAPSRASHPASIGRVVIFDFRPARRAEEGLCLLPTVATYEIGSVLRGQRTARARTMRFMDDSDGSGLFMEIIPVLQLWSRA
jgi:hypothetical protein